MYKEIKEESTTENCFVYFPYFNHQLYEIPSNIQEEENICKSDSDSQSLEDSSTSVSNETIDSNDNEEKFIPLNLLDFSPIKTSDDFEEKQIEEIPKPIKLFDLNDSEDKKTDDNEIKPKEIKPELQKYILPKSLFDTSKSKQAGKNENLNFKNPASASLALNQSSTSIPKCQAIPFIVYSIPPNTCLNNTMGNKFGQLPFNYKCMNYKNNNINKKKKKKRQEFFERKGDWSCYRCKNINFSFRNKCNKCQLPKEESEKNYIEVGEALLKLADVSIYEKK
jgi:hypothetical protein